MKKTKRSKRKVARRPARAPAWVYVTGDGKQHLVRPHGIPYTVKVNDLAAYERAFRAGKLVTDLGGPITDNRKTLQ